MQNKSNLANDGRFKLQITKSEIEKRGKLMFLKRGHTQFNSENINRDFVVQLTRKCLNEAVKCLRLSPREERILRTEREREIRKRNTEQSRKNKITQNEEEKIDLELLQNTRNNLILEKKELERDIEEYKVKLSSGNEGFTQ